MDSLVKPGRFAKEGNAMTMLRSPSYKLKHEDAIEVWHLYLDGWFQNRIAAKFDVNPGRINEIIKGKKYPSAESEAKKRRAKAA